MYLNRATVLSVALSFTSSALASSLDGKWRSFLPMPAHESQEERDLASNEDFDSLLVDRNGNDYEPYSLAWRYLGMYIDCDVDDSGSNNDERKLSEDEDCKRSLLWAAYVDPRYRGGEIGEYQFYDFSTGEYDKSSCTTRRCAKMNCHEPGTHFKLVGVFKETYGLYDWAEQLFKHEGYCIWDSDTYEFMQKYVSTWPTYCRQLSYTFEDDGTTLYLDTRPQGEGNITWGLYENSQCTRESNYTVSDYIKLYYYNYYGDSDYGESEAASWEAIFDMWNEYMNVYKVCQPCRAYNLNNDNDNSQADEHRRWLNDENDGEGDEEINGYNCYDDAGYTNCNQCYKFQSKTDMEPAEKADLVRASKQGTILRIKVNGRTYGKGGIYTQSMSYTMIVFLLTSAVCFIIGGIFLWRHKKSSKVDTADVYFLSSEVGSRDWPGVLVTRTKQFFQKKHTSQLGSEQPQENLQVHSKDAAVA